MKKWRCTVCGYIHEGAEPPEKCPVCGAPRSAFVEASLKPTVPPSPSSSVAAHDSVTSEQTGQAAPSAIPVVADPTTYAAYRQDRTKPDSIADDVDWNNVVAALNLEFGANRRYQYQITQLKHPKLTSILEGVMRTEGDHVDNAIKYLNNRLEAKLNSPDAKGLFTPLLFMRLNQEFEEIAQATYSQFAKETDDPALKALFTDQARSEFGHVNIFKEAVLALERGDYPVMFFCPVCGWELDYGSRPQAGDVKGCPKCGARFALSLEGGDWQLDKV